MANLLPRDAAIKQAITAAERYLSLVKVLAQREADDLITKPFERNIADAYSKLAGAHWELEQVVLK
jgi:hypothetical protein